MKVGLLNQYNFVSAFKMQPKPSFGRELSNEDKQKCEADSKEALNLLGVQNLSLILHGSSFPAAKKDFYIGSFFNDRSKDVYNLTRMFGFNSTQLGPNGMIRPDDVSPYGGNAFSNNYLFIDLNKLATGEYANVIDKNVLNTLKNTHEIKDQTDFVKAFSFYDVVLDFAYKNLKSKAMVNDDPAVKLHNEFSDYKKGKKWLESDALYSVLRKFEYQNKPHEEWKNIDKNLIKYCAEGNEDALDRKSEIEAKYRKQLDVYKFKQFIYDKQLRSFVQENGDRVDFIADALVGFSEADVWGHSDAFLEGYALGCPGGGPNNSHQVWNIPVINPKRLFKEDGSLDVGGKLIKAKFERLLEDSKAVRIDHAIGLVDPWYYRKDSVREEYDSKGDVSKISTDGRNVSCSDLDPDKNFGKVLEKIILPLFEEKGIEENDVVWEDLGNQTQFFREIYYDKHKLSGLKTMRYEKAENLKTDNPNDTWMAGSHDHEPLANDMENLKTEDSFNPLYLAGYLYPNWTDEQRASIVKGIENDPRERLKYKMVEMLAKGKNIQISFMDFFGLNKVYNYMGKKDERNWKLRLTPEFEKDYYQTLEAKRKDKIALNMPELIARALESKLASRTEDEQKNKVQEQKINGLISRLQNYANTLYEEEN